MTQKRICVVKEHSSLKELDKMIKSWKLMLEFLKGFISSDFSIKGWE